MICMDIRGNTISLCMAVIIKKFLKKQGSSLIFSLNLASISVLTTHDLESKKVRKQLQELLYSKSSKMFLTSLQWRVLFQAWTV